MPVNEVEVLTAVGSGAFGEKVVQIKLDKMYGGTAFSLTYGASRNFINRLEVPYTPDGHDWGREWQTCWFEGSGGVLTAWVNPTQAAGYGGRNNNQVLSFLRRRDLPAYEGHRADVWGRSTIRYKEYSPPESEAYPWGPYKRNYYQTIDYPNTHVLGTVKYTAGWYHRGPIRGGVTYPCATFSWDMYDERGQPVYIEMMDSLVHLEIPDSNPEVLLGNYVEQEGWKVPVRSRWIHAFLPDSNLTLSFNPFNVTTNGSFTYSDRVMCQRHPVAHNLFIMKFAYRLGTAYQFSGSARIVFREGQATELWTD